MKFAIAALLITATAVKLNDKFMPTELLDQSSPADVNAVQTHEEPKAAEAAAAPAEEKKEEEKKEEAPKKEEAKKPKKMDTSLPSRHR